MVAVCKTWRYPLLNHRPLCQQEYEPVDTLDCPICVSPYIPEPDCSNLPVGSYPDPITYCDYVPPGNEPFEYVRNFPRWLKVTITPGSSDNDPQMWPCWQPKYRGTFILYNGSLCNNKWVTIKEYPICYNYVGGQWVCSEETPGASKRIEVTLVYDNSNPSYQNQYFRVDLNWLQFGCGSSVSTQSFKSEGVYGNGGWRLNCKDTHRMIYGRTRNFTGQLIWARLDNPTYFTPNPGFSITVSPV